MIGTCNGRTRAATKFVITHRSAVRPDAEERKVHIVQCVNDTAVVRIWDASSGVELTQLDQREVSVEDATFSPDGLRVVTTPHAGVMPGQDFDYTARIWDAISGAELARLRGMPKKNGMRASP